MIKFKIEDEGPERYRILFSYYPREKQKELRNQVIEKVSDIYKTMNIDQCRSQLEVEKAVNDWLVKNGKWTDADEEKEREEYHRRHNVLGILLDGKGVCISFAQAASLLLNCFGVQSFVIIGRMKEGNDFVWGKGYKPLDLIDTMEEIDEIYCDNLPMKKPDSLFNNGHLKKPLDYSDEEWDSWQIIGHAWNYVCIDGKDRQLDVTFNAAAGGKKDFEGIHAYFNWTEEEIRRQRYIDFGLWVRH